MVEYILVHTIEYIWFPVNYYAIRDSFMYITYKTVFSFIQLNRVALLVDRIVPEAIRNPVGLAYLLLVPCLLTLHLHIIITGIYI